MNQINIILQKHIPMALLPDERPLFCAFAGLYDIWKDKNDGKEIHSYTTITTVPNMIVGGYHDRIPVIL
jgi:putative SOS response-associated peptidase YedK